MVRVGNHHIRATVALKGSNKTTTNIVAVVGKTIWHIQSMRSRTIFGKVPKMAKRTISGERIRSRRLCLPSTAANTRIFCITALRNGRRLKPS